MILVDANVLMYASGAEHPNKEAAIVFLQKVAAGKVDAAIDAEVLQEVIHRYTSLRLWEEGRKVYAVPRSLFPEVLAVTGLVMDQAKVLVDQLGFVSARDAVHAAVVVVNDLDGICSFDSDFDRIPGCKRIQP